MKIRTEGKTLQNRIKVFVAYKLSRSNSQIAQSLANLGGIADYMLFIRRIFGAVAYQKNSLQIENPLGVKLCGGSI